MDWKPMMNELSKVLQAPVKHAVMPAKEWTSLVEAQKETAKEPRSVVKDHIVYFLFGDARGSVIDVLQVEEVLVTPSEKRLVEMVLRTHSGLEASDRSGELTGDAEEKIIRIKDWILQQIDSGMLQAEMPEALSDFFTLDQKKIPFLLTGDYSDNRTVSYHELKKLLESFFDEEIILIPLMDKEWLILGSELLLSAADEDDKTGGPEESLEEALESIGGGLYEMLANEWVGESHVAVHYPIVPSQGIVSVVRELRETLSIGKRYHVSENLYFPWSLHLEKLLYSAADAEKIEYVDHIFKEADRVLDPETLSTLEQFFALDCNVSETAKKLYIHRNTLLYRLDKFKQETGRDVRSFGDGVLVQIALLLYKVTKRR